jgi:DNA-binding NarL/FixJ family response regulator
MDQPLRILIVDDDVHVRAGVRAFLATGLRCEIVGEAVNGQEAIAQVVLHRPDVVLLDLHMPVLDGMQATRIIKEQWPEIAIVALTIYPGQYAAALAAGADAFVSKGDSPDRLIKALQSIQHPIPRSTGTMQSNGGCQA